VITLDPTAALVVIDLQAGIRAIGAPGTEEVVARSAELARAFRASGRPVVLVNVDGRAPGRTDGGAPGATTMPPEFAVLVPELEAAGSDVLVTKRSVGTFATTDLDVRLRELGVTQVVLTGIATTAGVESTGRAAYDLGYHVAYVTDAMTDRSPENHAHALANVLPRHAETGTTAEVLALL
jgi:nicotinamidase-related amidase